MGLSFAGVLLFYVGKATTEGQFVKEEIGGEKLNSRRNISANRLTDLGLGSVGLANIYCFYSCVSHWLVQPWFKFAAFLRLFLPPTMSLAGESAH